MREALRKEPVVSADETGWRVAADSWWLWVVCSEQTTVHDIVPHRCATVVGDILGEDFEGLLMRDGWRSYDRQLSCGTLRCLLHLMHSAEDLEDAQGGVAAQEAVLVTPWTQGVLDLRSRPGELTDEEYRSSPAALARSAARSRGS